MANTILRSVEGFDIKSKITNVRDYETQKDIFVPKLNEDGSQIFTTEGYGVFTRKKNIPVNAYIEWFWRKFPNGSFSSQRLTSNSENLTEEVYKVTMCDNINVAPEYRRQIDGYGCFSSLQNGRDFAMKAAYGAAFKNAMRMFGFGVDIEYEVEDDLYVSVTKLGIPTYIPLAEFNELIKDKNSYLHITPREKVDIPDEATADSNKVTSSDELIAKTSSKEATTNEEETSSEEAVTNEEETSLEEATTDEEETSSEEAITNEEETTLEEAITNEEETSLEEAITNEEETSSEEETSNEVMKENATIKKGKLVIMLENDETLTFDCFIDKKTKLVSIESEREAELSRFKKYNTYNSEYVEIPELNLKYSIMYGEDKKMYLKRKLKAKAATKYIVKYEGFLVGETPNNHEPFLGKTVDEILATKNGKSLLMMLASEKYEPLLNPNFSKELKAIMTTIE